MKPHRESCLAKFHIQHIADNGADNISPAVIRFLVKKQTAQEIAPDFTFHRHFRITRPKSGQHFLLRRGQFLFRNHLIETTTRHAKVSTQYLMPPQ